MSKEVHMKITSEESWKDIPDGTIVTLLDLSIRDAYSRELAHIVGKKFMKRHQRLTLKSMEKHGPFRKGKLFQFGIGLKFSYEYKENKS